MATDRLLQELMLESHNDRKVARWRMLVACIMLNQTSRAQVDKVIWTFLSRWPTPRDLYAVYQDSSGRETRAMQDLLAPLGFGSRRSAALKAMTRDYMAWKQRTGDVKALHGCGDYAQASWDIFVRGRVDVETTDKELQKHLKRSVSKIKAAPPLKRGKSGDVITA